MCQENLYETAQEMAQVPRFADTASTAPWTSITCRRRCRCSAGYDVLLEKPSARREELRSCSGRCAGRSEADDRACCVRAFYVAIKQRLSWRQIGDLAIHSTEAVETATWRRHHAGAGGGGTN